jgi:DNA-binding NarL/FixJ family response regulator
MKHITVVLADDHHVVRQALHALLESTADIRVIGEASDGYEAVRVVRELLPQVAVLDFAMPLLNGAEAARKISGDIPEVKTLVLSCHHEKAFVQRALRCGALGYLSKDAAATEVFAAIRSVASGEKYLDSHVAAASRHLVTAEDDSAEVSPASLTPRQIEVLRLIAEGRANKQIAASLSISIKTVEKHRQEVMDRLSIHNTAGLTRYAVEAGLVPHVFHAVA